MSITNLLHRVSQIVSEKIAVTAAGSADYDGLTARQIAVLEAIYEHGDKPNQTQICQMTGIDRSTLADIVRRLVIEKKYLRRNRTKDDMRAYALQLTADGEAALKFGRAIRTKAEAQVLAMISQTDQKSLERALTKIMEAHEQDNSAPSLVAAE